MEHAPFHDRSFSRVPYFVRFLKRKFMKFSSHSIYTFMVDLLYNKCYGKINNNRK